MTETVDDRDRKIIAAQLGREPRGPIQVERRCPYGFPTVIRVHPLLDGQEPFPTLFWLSCPILVEQISRLEEQGEIRRMEQRITGDDELNARYAENQRAYIKERWAALSEKEKRLLNERGWETALRERGIGGLQDLGRVKCLHMHYAHHLAWENVIGAQLDEHFPIEACPPDDVICERFDVESDR
ncbi:MAG: DUF501 domain-containing protein [Candidatus Bipolaricaulia bacterium]